MAGRVCKICGVPIVDAVDILKRDRGGNRVRSRVTVSNEIEVVRKATFGRINCEGGGVSGRVFIEAVPSVAKKQLLTDCERLV